MTDSKAIADVRKRLADSGVYLVGADPLPIGGRHILIVGSSHTKLHPGTTAQLIADVYGCPVEPLPRVDAYENLYYFLVGPATSPVAVGALEQASEAFLLAAVFKEPLLTAEQYAWYRSALEGEVPEFFAPDAPIAPNTWVFLLVKYSDMASFSTEGLKWALEKTGLSVIDPLAGVSGFFESLFYRSDYVGTDYAVVLLNSLGEANISSDKLQTSVFNVFGNTPGGQPRAVPRLFTTKELLANQDAAADFHWAQSGEGAVSDLGKGVVDVATGLMNVLNKVLGVLPTIVWVMLGAAVAYVGWRGYKYVRDEMKE